MNTEILQQLGLDRNEAKIYEALLEIGKVNVSSISSTSKVNRRNVYDSLKKLLQRKLVTQIYSSKEKLYQAEKPEKLFDIINQQKQIIHGVLPELKSIYQKHVPQEQAFMAKGKEAVKNFWQYVLQHKDTTVYFFNGKGALHDPEIDRDREEYYKEMKKNRIVFKGFFDFEISQWGKDVYEKYDLKYIRFMPPEYSTRASGDVCLDRIVVFPMPKDLSVENVTVFTIISKPLADSYITWLEYMWQHSLTLEQAKVYDTNITKSRFNKK